MTDIHKKLTVITYALYETVKEAGIDGAPSGYLYLACMQHGISLDAYEAVMSAMVKRGIIRHANHVYYFVKPFEGDQT